MSVEGVGLEGELSVINFDEEYGFKDRLSETVIAVASKILAFSSNVNCLIQMTFAPIHSNEYGQNTSAVQEVAKRLFRLVILTSNLDGGTSLCNSFIFCSCCCKPFS